MSVPWTISKGRVKAMEEPLRKCQGVLEVLVDLIAANDGVVSAGRLIIVLPQTSLFWRWMLLDFSQALCLFDTCLSRNLEVYWSVGSWV